MVESLLLEGEGARWFKSIGGIVIEKPKPCHPFMSAGRRAKAFNIFCEGFSHSSLRGFCTLISAKVCT